MLKIIKASAGSGKTYTLALEYITLLLGEKDKESGTYRLANVDGREYHRHILAVTFTNKATEEMKERIIKELAVLAGCRDGGRSPYLATLCERFATEEKKIRHAAGRALGELLFDYTNFNVSTIDSFFQIILRTFAGEIDVPYDYNIELNEKYAMQVGIRDFLSRLRRNDSLAGNPVVGWLKKYVTEKINEGSGWNIFSSISPQQGGGDLFKFAAVINTEQYRKASRQMAEYFAESNGGNVGKFQVAVGNMAEKCRSLINVAARNVLQIIDDNGATDFMKTNGTAAMLCRLAKNADAINNEKTDNLFKYMEQPEKVLNKMAKNEALRNSIIRNIAPEMEKIASLYADFLLLNNMSRHIYTLGLLSGISGSVGRFRKDNNLILLSDTNELLNEVISEEDTPFIYERIGVWINNFLVDEFQDTSALQWQNFKPLLSNSLSSGNDNLIIGDEKQCIYRFRNSDPSLLQYRVKEQFGSRAMVDGSKNVNWRSAPDIVKFNNTFFTLAAIRMDVADVYGNVVQMPNDKQRKVKGYVRVEILNPPEKKRNCNSDTDENAETGELKFTDKVLERLPSELSAILDRGYRQSDIAILVNTNTEGAAVIKRLLEYNLEETAVRNFKVISSDSLLLKNSPTVRLIISHLRYLGVAMELRDGLKTDRQELEEKIHRLLRQYEKYLNQGHTPEQAMELAVTSPVSKADMLGEIDEFVPRNSQCHNLVSVVERIIEKAVSKEAREHENPFIAALQDYVIDFSSRGNPSIRSFVDWWDRTCDKLSITSPAGVDAINVMTIHKSKGLEFPCVIIPFANWEMCKPDGTVWFSRDEVLRTGLFDNDAAVPPIVPVKYYRQLDTSRLASAYNERVKESVIDALNKTYVAFTRAVDELHIFTERPEKPAETLGSLLLSECLCDFGSDSCLPERVDELNDKHGRDVALGVTATETGYTAGEIANNDRDAAELPKITSMLPYFVENRHDLAHFDLPEVFYTVQQERGVLLHKILGMIHNESEVERCLKYCRVRCIVLPERYNEISSIIRRILVQNDEVRRWFARGNKVYKERTISAEGKHYRPDRVVITPDGETIVVDFKFGDKHLPSYRQQVKKYMELVAEAGMPRVSGRIWYPLEGVIEKVE